MEKYKYLIFSSTFLNLISELISFACSMLSKEAVESVTGSLKSHNAGKTCQLLVRTRSLGLDVVRGKDYLV